MYIKVLEKTKKIIIIITIISIFINYNVSIASGKSKFQKMKQQTFVEKTTSDNLTIQSDTAVLIDAKTGVVLYNKNMDKIKEPASTTKMVTAILAIEHLNPDEIVTVDLETAHTEGSRIYLMEGEKITVDELLYALLVQSANDAAVALAKKISVTTSDFAQKMNDKARQIGATRTHFINPNGLHSDGHVSTAYDLAMIARYAMTNKDFRKYVSTVRYTIEPTNLQEEKRYLKNTNKLLYDEWNYMDINGQKKVMKYEGATGVKTGYTPEAGGCLVASAKKGDTELIAVSLDSEPLVKFADCTKMLDWGFENYKTVKVFKKGENIGVGEVQSGRKKQVDVAPINEIYVTIKKNNNKELMKVFKIEELKAPLQKGEEIGTVDIFDGSDLLISVPLKTLETIQVADPIYQIKAFIKRYDIMKFIVAGFILFVCVMVIMIIVARYINLKKRRKKRKELALKIAMEREMEKLEANRRKYGKSLEEKYRGDY